MKVKLAIIMAILFSFFMLFYGGYYLINPDLQGEEILNRQGIPYPTVIAHRGASIEAPESTAAAYIKAREMKADYLEADLQRTKDGEIVVIHDQTLGRTSNVEEIFPKRKDDPVGSFTYKELKKLDFGSWFNQTSRYAREEYQGLEILTLTELIEIAKGGEHTPGLILETKDSQKYPGIEAEIVDILEEEGWLAADKEKEDFAKTIFFSFKEDSLREFKELIPEIPRLLLITDNMITRRSWAHWLGRAEGLADGLGTKGFMSWPWYIAAAHEKGLFVFPYTINELWQVKVLAHFQSSGYITDRPDVVLDFLDRIPKSLVKDLEDEV
ncbi:glycerophosphodiester phosphodiesterase family protein [Fuchsiella alkaliacetigena]|uniref:glycerophosphodiester phosphodiesterase family protein n=1 Tax=Fuchsiella alkaliacetigena TaxID=957042 RepID=UPI00200B63CB|nr:glycerophosphodiester phosphodiesterase family protein [Fuchsiella alkaliacetigena]MCK8823783.1 glycerophosphodiester phosphodiesterase [Fuchsiella alkaliacetigena]